MSPSLSCATDCLSIGCKQIRSNKEETKERSPQSMICRRISETDGYNTTKFKKYTLLTVLSVWIILGNPFQRSH